MSPAATATSALVLLTLLNLHRSAKAGGETRQRRAGNPSAATAAPPTPCPPRRWTTGSATRTRPPARSPGRPRGGTEGQPPARSPPACPPAPPAASGAAPQER